MIPKGRLILIGGAEDMGEKNNHPDIIRDNMEFTGLEILKSLLPDKRNIDVEIITTASKVPKTVGESYRRAFYKLKVRKVGVLNIENREQANKTIYAERIKKADVVLFTGGDQFRLATILGCTEVIKEIATNYDRRKNFVIAGTSAGAMALSKTMLYEGHKIEAMIKGDVKTSAGLGFLDYCVIDTHFVKRGRLGRLTQAVLMNPACVGIGLGEDTALVITKGNKMECIGSGMVVIVDAHKIGHTNIAYAEEGTPVCIENLIIHMLASGNTYLLKEKKFLPDKKDIKKEETDGITMKKYQNKRSSR
jgi:cyanophycinase